MSSKAHCRRALFRCARISRKSVPTRRHDCSPPPTRRSRQPQALKRLLSEVMRNATEKQPRLGRSRDQFVFPACCLPRPGRARAAGLHEAQHGARFRQSFDERPQVLRGGEQPWSPLVLRYPMAPRRRSCASASISRTGAISSRSVNVSGGGRMKAEGVRGLDHYERGEGPSCWKAAAKGMLQSRHVTTAWRRSPTTARRSNPCLPISVIRSSAACRETIRESGCWKAILPRSSRSTRTATSRSRHCMSVILRSMRWACAATRRRWCANAASGRERARC